MAKVKKTKAPSRRKTADTRGLPGNPGKGGRGKRAMPRKAGRR